MDTDPFYEFEHRGWEEVARQYDDTWAQVTRQSIGPLLDAAHVQDGTAVLDVACGPGYVAAAAAARGATATGIDFSAQMIAEARTRHPGVRYDEGDAEQLAFAGSTFDAVVLNFGILHLAQPERALAEAYRVLRPGGRIAFTVWDTADHAIGHGIVLQAVQQYGDLTVPLPAGPSFFRFSDPDEAKRALTAAGFRESVVTHVDQLWCLPSANCLFDVMYYSSVRNAALLRAQEPQVLDKIKEMMHDAVRSWNNVLPMRAVLASAVR